MSMAIMPFNVLGLPISPNASPNLCIILWVFKSYSESEALFGACLCRAQNTSETPSHLVTSPSAWLRAATSESPLASAAHALELTGGLWSWQSPWVAMSSAQETACRRTAGPRLEAVCSRFSHRRGKLCGEWTLTHIFHIFTYFFSMCHPAIRHFQVSEWPELKWNAHTTQIAEAPHLGTGRQEWVT